MDFLPPSHVGNGASDIPAGGRQPKTLHAPYIPEKISRREKIRFSRHDSISHPRQTRLEGDQSSPKNPLGKSRHSTRVTISFPIQKEKNNSIKWESHGCPFLLFFKCPLLFYSPLEGTHKKRRNLDTMGVGRNVEGGK